MARGLETTNWTLIDKRALRGLDRNCIRFRPYLLAAFKNFESDLRRRT